MLRLDKEIVQLEEDCPGCKRPLVATYFDIYSRREVKCRKCGSAVRFDSSAAHNVQHALQELERSEDKLDKAMKEIFKKAEVTIKK